MKPRSNARKKPSSSSQDRQSADSASILPAESGGLHSVVSRNQAIEASGNAPAVGAHRLLEATADDWSRSGDERTAIRDRVRSASAWRFGRTTGPTFAIHRLSNAPIGGDQKGKGRMSRFFTMWVVRAFVASVLAIAAALTTASTLNAQTPTGTIKGASQ